MERVDVIRVESTAQTERGDRVRDAVRQCRVSRSAWILLHPNVGL